MGYDGNKTDVAPPPDRPPMPSNVCPVVSVISMLRLEEDAMVAMVAVIKNERNIAALPVPVVSDPLVDICCGKILEVWRMPPNPALGPKLQSLGDFVS